MKIFLVLSAVLACAMSQVLYPGLGYHGFGYNYANAPYAYSPYLRTLPAPIAPVPVPAPYVPVTTSSQYHAQDELGQFTFGHAGDNQARVESKRFDGTVTGAYSYVDPNGKVINVNYLADSKGFRVLGANNLPESPAVPDVPALVGPEPVQDTPEVMAAKADFAKAFAEAEKASAAAPEVTRRRRSAVLYSSVFAPALTKSTIKYHTYEPVDAKTAADTKKIELTEKETEVLTPTLQYAATPFAYHAAAPVVSTYHTSYAVPHFYGHPYAYHL